MQASDTVLDCLHHADMSGIWQTKETVPVDHQQDSSSELSKEIHVSSTELVALETLWSTAYEQQRDNWRKKRT